MIFLTYFYLQKKDIIYLLISFRMNEVVAEKSRTAPVSG